MASYEKNSRLLFEAALKLGLKPRWLTSYGIFSFTHKNREFYMFGSAGPLNRQINSYLAGNKHATRQILKKNKLPNIPYLLPKSLTEARRFLNKHKTVIAKPVRGSMAIDAKLIRKKEDFKKVNLGLSILEKFIKGQELRVLVLNNKVISIHEKRSKSSIHAPRKVKRVVVDKWNPAIVKTAQLAVQAIGLNFCSVDFIVTGDRFYILEINSSPAIWREHRPDVGRPVDIASQILRSLLKQK